MPPINATLGFSEQRRRSQIQLFSTNYSLLVQTPTVIKSKAQISDDEFHAHLEQKKHHSPPGGFLVNLWNESV